MNKTYKESLSSRLLVCAVAVFVSFGFLLCAVVIIMKLGNHPLAFALATVPFSIVLLISYFAIRNLTHKWSLKLDNDTLHIGGCYRFQKIPLRQIASIMKEVHTDEDGEVLRNVIRDHSGAELLHLGTGDPRMDEFLEAVRLQIVRTKLSNE